jgi:hypothetical protein
VGLVTARVFVCLAMASLFRRALTAALSQGHAACVRCSVGEGARRVVFFIRVWGGLLGDCFGRVDQA